MNQQLTVQDPGTSWPETCATASAAPSTQAYRDGMEDQLGALGLVVNAVVLWTTRYLDPAIDQLRAEGHAIRGEDVARLSPLSTATSTCSVATA